MSLLSGKKGRRKRREKFLAHPGTSPGELAHLPGAEYHPTARITVIDFRGDHFLERTVEQAEECFGFAATDSVTWINVEGLGDLEVIRKLGEAYKLHPLALEDVLHTSQRPKVDDYGDFLFLICRELHEKDSFETEQIALFLGKNYLITFQETIGDPFEGVRERLRKGRPRLRTSGPDYLAYALLDAVMDSYFPILERYGTRLESLEEEASLRPDQETPLRIQEVRRDLIEMRGVAWSTREMFASLQRMESELITKDTQVYIRDVHDHGVGVMEILETYREIAAGIRDIYFSRMGVRTNEIMKALTLIATVFMPLTFLVGVYGMNFEHMPGLHSKIGFWVFTLFMLLITLGMITWFRKKRWI